MSGKKSEYKKKQRKQNNVFTTYAKIIYMKIYVIFVDVVVVVLAVKQHTIHHHLACQ